MEKIIIVALYKYEVAKYVKGFFKIAITDYAKQYGIEF